LTSNIFGRGFNSRRLHQINTLIINNFQCPTKNDQYWKRCSCPKWLYINNNGKRSQRSAKTRAWDRAEETRRAVERDFEDAEQRKRAGAEPNKELATSLGDAVSRFLSAKEQENLSPSTVAKLTTIFAKQLLSWATEHNIKTLERIGGEELEAFRATWKDAPPCAKEKAGTRHRVLLLLPANGLD
jgi:integrase/recombinase XerD